MHHKDIKIGKTYAVKVSGRVVPVKVEVSDLLATVARVRLCRKASSMEWWTCPRCSLCLHINSESCPCGYKPGQAHVRELTIRAVPGVKHIRPITNRVPVKHLS